MLYILGIGNHTGFCVYRRFYLPWSPVTAVALICLSPLNSVLYLGGTYRRSLRKFRVKPLYKKRLDGGDNNPSTSRTTRPASASRVMSRRGCTIILHCYPLDQFSSPPPPRPPNHAGKQHIWLCSSQASVDRAERKRIPPELTLQLAPEDVGRALARS